MKKQKLPETLIKSAVRQRNMMILRKFPKLMVKIGNQLNSTIKPLKLPNVWIQLKKSELLISRNFFLKCQVSILMKLQHFLPHFFAKNFVKATILPKFSDAGIQDISTSISITVKFEEMTEDDDESDIHLEARDRRYSCLTFLNRTQI